MDHRRLSTALKDWEEAKSSGQGVLAAIAEARVALTHVDSTISSKSSAFAASALGAHCLESAEGELAHRLAKLSIDLADSHATMRSACATLRDIATQLDQSSGEERPGSVPHSVVRLAKEMCVMFEDQLQAATLILEDAPLCPEPDTLALYSATWLMEPFISEPAVATTLEAFGIGPRGGR